LRAAIQNYEERHGIITKKVPTTVEIIRKRLKKVMNPISGLDLVRTNLVNDIKVKDGIVEIIVELPPDHQFTPAIREEITEKIEPLWDVKKVIINFQD